ncbi:MAG: hypothetical protein AMXMBFR58_17660 [Phycisphaerae bacterium]
MPGPTWFGSASSDRPTIGTIRRGEMGRPARARTPAATVHIILMPRVTHPLIVIMVAPGTH